MTDQISPVAPGLPLEEYERRKGKVVMRLLRTELADFSGKHVLEIGPSTGALMRLLEDAGSDVHAIDVDSPWSRDYVYHSSKRTLLNLETEALPEWMVGRFDLVIAQEVIEHIKRPYDFISQVKLALKPQGLLFITTPNLVGITAWIKGEKWCGLTTPTHYILYSPRSLSFLMENLGFRTVRIFANLIPIAIASRVPLACFFNKLLGPLKFGGGLMAFYRPDRKSSK